MLPAAQAGAAGGRRAGRWGPRLMEEQLQPALFTFLVSEVCSVSGDGGGRLEGLPLLALCA